MVDDNVSLARSKSLFASESKKFIVYEPPSFESTLVNATRQLCCDFNVQATREMHHAASRGPVNESLSQSDREPSNISSSIEQSKRYSLGSGQQIHVTAIYDGSRRITEILMHHEKQVPRQLLQIISYIIPGYSHLTKMTLKYCSLDKYTIHEMVKIVDASTVSELCFDGSSLSEGNYAVLLAGSGLKALSLSRCNLNDIVCEQISAKLSYFENRSLLLLNLSMNKITDHGAKAIAWALRTNRSLRYLNLAGNQITDDGALCLFDSLMMFPLTYDECIGKRTRYMEYVKDMVEVTHEILENGVAASLRYHQHIKSVSPHAVPDEIALGKVRAEMLAAQTVGPFTDPFSVRSTVLKNGYRYCVGNMALSYLNLAYNNLTYPSLKKLEKVVSYQRARREPSQIGLIRLVLDGNNLPVDSVEYHVIRDILTHYISTRLKKKEDKRKSKVTIAKR